MINAGNMITEVNACGFAKINSFTFIDSQESIMSDQKSWGEYDTCKKMDFTTSPYWITVAGQSPVAIENAEALEAWIRYSFI